MTTVEFTSDVVRSTRFREKMRGYHPEEVDAFMERAATALEVLQGRLAEVTERAMKAEAALESNSETDESIRRTLTLAQRTAEMAVNEAKDEADRLRDDAEAEVGRLREQTDEECRRLVDDAEATANELRSESERIRDEARADASAKVAEAERQADELHRQCEERIAAAERESRERIDAAQAEADARLAAQAEEAHRDLEASVASLTAQRTELRAHVEALAVYLAEERARVLETLGTAIEAFGTTLNPAPRSAVLESAMTATDPVVAIVEATAIESGEPATAWTTINDFRVGPAAASEWETADDDADEPGSAEASAPVPSESRPAADGVVSEDDEFAGPAAVWFPGVSTAREATTDDAWDGPVGSDDEAVGEAEAVGSAEAAAGDPGGEGVEPPSTLLFTLEDELRDPDEPEEERIEAKPRKTLLGRRRG